MVGTGGGVPAVVQPANEMLLVSSVTAFARISSTRAAYNWLVLLSFPLSAAAAFLLARYPGGRAIVGVPNQFDPFLRPLLSLPLQAIGLYGYGYEKSYSRRALKQMLERAGLDVVAETAILFIPGWLRMLGRHEARARTVDCKRVNTLKPCRTDAYMELGVPNVTAAEPQTWSHEV